LFNRQFCYSRLTKRNKRITEKTQIRTISHVSRKVLQKLKIFSFFANLIWLDNNENKITCKEQVYPLLLLHSFSEGCLFQCHKPLLDLPSQLMCEMIKQWQRELSSKSDPWLIRYSWWTETWKIQKKLDFFPISFPCTLQ